MVGNVCNNHFTPITAHRSESQIPMSKAIRKAIRDYQAATKPAAIRKAIRTAKARGFPQSAADVRWSAAMDLRDDVEQGIPR